MLIKSLKYYISSFYGFSPQVWYLALVTLINRAGTMVVPFLSLYLTENLKLSFEQVGWIMSCFGIGSVAGSWLGGKLSDKIGYFPTMLGSLILSGLAFFVLMQLHTFYSFSIGVLVLMILSDAFRPAMFVALRNYSTDENRTRSVSLIRLAINLGFSAGPAIGGMLILNFGYEGLFWVDGLTCILAAILLKVTIQKQAKITQSTSPSESLRVSPYRDTTFLTFLLATFFVTAAFLQFFSTVPLFYSDVHHLNEKQIGWLLGLNGFLIFMIEMPLIRFFERPGYSIYRMLTISTFLILLSFLVFNLSTWSGILVLSMLLLTFGEMLNFPFLNRFTMERAGTHNTGAYMALYSMTFGISHIFSHNAGLQLVAAYGYQVTWYVMCGLLILAMLIFGWLKMQMNPSNQTNVETER